MFCLDREQYADIYIFGENEESDFGRVEVSLFACDPSKSTGGLKVCLNTDLDSMVKHLSPLNFKILYN